MMHITIADRYPFIASRVQHLPERGDYRVTVGKACKPLGVPHQDGLVPDLILYRAARQ